MTRSQSLKVGVFTLVALLVTATTLLVLANLSLWRETSTYWVRFPYSVSGLSEGARVELWGVRIGDVESIALDGEQVRVALRIREGIDVPRSAQAHLKFEGITGLKYIDIEGGELGGPTLDPGEYLEAAPGNLDLAIDDAIATVGTLRQITHKLDSLLEDLAGTVDDNRRHLSEALRASAETTTILRQASRDLAVIARAARREAPPMLASLRKAARSAQLLGERGEVIADDLVVAASQARRATGTIAVESRAIADDLHAAIFDLRTAMATARGWMRNLEANPSSLLRGGSREELPPP